MSDEQAGICRFNGCGHPFASHTPFNDTQICGECARPWEGLGVGGEFHVFLGPRLAGGTFDPDAEQRAYEQAMLNEQQ
jgi:hypothetical protein